MKTQKECTCDHDKVVFVEGLRAPGTTGWNKAWVGLRFEDGSLFAGIFDDGMDFLPNGNRISQKEYDDLKNAEAIRGGWTEVMSAEDGPNKGRYAKAPERKSRGKDH